MQEYYYDSTLTGEELDAALKKVSQLDAAVADAQSSAKAAESWAQGGTGTRAGENTDNAEYWAGQAKANQTAAADSESKAKSSADAAKLSETASKTSENNAKASATAAGASQSAAAASAAAAADSASAAANSESGSADNADRADAAAESAAGDAERAEAAAKLAQAIAQGQKGYYATPEALKAAFPSGEDGDWAIVGTTDTIWIWDADDGAWEDSGNKTDLSHYYTREETDAEIDELQAALTKEMDGKLAGKLGKSETSSAANKLAAAHTIQTDLGSSAAVGFDGSKDIAPGVKGVLPVTHGGTGVTTIAGLRDSINASYHGGIGAPTFEMAFNSGTANVPNTSTSNTLVDNAIALIRAAGPQTAANLAALVLGYNNIFTETDTYIDSLPSRGKATISMTPLTRDGARGVSLLHDIGTSDLYLADIYDGKQQGNWHKVYTDGDLAAIISAVISKFSFQSGTISPTLSASSYPNWGQFTVTFPRAYASTPIVNITTNGYYGTENLSITSINPTNFTVRQYITAAGTHPFIWQAFGIIL